jgi:multidrug transporter EmrE-like cation transporter
MVICCTLFASAAQILLKVGMLQPLPAVDPSHLGSIFALAAALVRNVPLIVGFCFHGCNALLLILALRDGELSILWPVYALSYVWVALLSMHFFGDHMNPWKGAGIALIILGVSLLGRASQRAAVRP